MQQNQKTNHRRSEYYTTQCLLDYDHIKLYHRLTPVDLSRQKELDTDPKLMQQI